MVFGANFAVFLRHRIWTISGRARFAMARSRIDRNMKRIFVLLALSLAVPGLSVLAQKVTVTSQTRTYTRPKPITEYKKHFKVTRAIVKAATPALSRRITDAISPEKLLSFNLKEELGEYQWLEESGFSVLYNDRGILSMELSMEGTAAYPDSVTKHVIVDTKTGKALRAADLFSDLPKLAAAVSRRQKKEIADAIKEIKANPETADEDTSSLFAEARFTVAELKDLAVVPDGVVFYYNYGFPHVLKGLEPDGEYKFTWAELSPFIRRGGLLASFVR